MSDAENTGFDPRLWNVAVAPAAACAPSVSQEIARAGLPGRRALLAGGGLLIAAGPVLSWAMRERDAEASAETPTAAPRAAVQAPASDLVERTATLRDGGEFAPMLIAQGVSPADAAALTRIVSGHLAGPGAITATISLRLDGGVSTVLRVKAVRDDSSGIVLTRDATAAGGWRSESLARALASELVVVRGEMNAESLYASALAAGGDESLIPDFAAAFVYDFDFQREIHPGDVFEMTAERSVNADGAAVGAPTLVFASFTTADKARALYRFAPTNGKFGWYDGNGRSIVRSLMRTPVDGARVSSTFGWRVHPVLGFRKMHNGTDFAVPSGTPVFAAGKGVVETAHFSASAGNMVILRHEKGRETKYFHFTSFAPGVVTGANVEQGQQIGLSGTTGRSTGPHLHYEVHLDGVPIDPMTVETDAGETLAGAVLDAFRRERDRIDAARTVHAR